MSYPSLLYGIKKFFIEHLTYNNRKLDENSVDNMVDGRPPGNCGEMFISVHPGGFRGQSQEYIDALHQANVTVTIRTAKTPFDRMGRFSVIDKELGLGNLVQKIVEYVHLNYIIVEYANDFIEDKKVNRWIEPLRLNVVSPPRLVGGDWFHADTPAQEEAVIQTISFGDARRIQFGAFQPYPQDMENFLLPPHLKDT